MRLHPVETDAPIEPEILALAAAIARALAERDAELEDLAESSAALPKAAG